MPGIFLVRKQTVEDFCQFVVREGAIRVECGYQIEQVENGEFQSKVILDCHDGGREEVSARSFQNIRVMSD